MTQSGSGKADTAWKALYWMGGIAALLAVFVFRRFLSAELAALGAFGLLAVPDIAAFQAVDWLTLLHTSPWIGLTLLDFFDLVEYVLYCLLLLAVCAALWNTNRRMSLLAGLCGLAGICLALASNQALALFSLSREYAQAATETRRAELLAQGEAHLAEQAQKGGYYASLFLVWLSGLLISILMLRSEIFGNATGWTGIIANSLGLALFPVLVFAPALMAIPPSLSAPFRMAWYLLIAIRLFKLARRGPAKQVVEAELEAA